MPLWASWSAPAAMTVGLILGSAALLVVRRCDPFGRVRKTEAVVAAVSLVLGLSASVVLAQKTSIARRPRRDIDHGHSRPRIGG